MLITGNFNKLSFDHTKWYTLTDKAFSILQNCQIELTKMSNEILQNCQIRFDKNVKPIPVNKTFNKTFNKRNGFNNFENQSFNVDDLDNSSFFDH